MYLLQITTQATQEVGKVTSQAVGYFDILKNKVLNYAPQCGGGHRLLYHWFMGLIGKLVGMMRKVLTRRSYDASLQTFLVSLVKVALTILLLVSIAGILGVDTTAFGALIVGAGVAIGSALNGTLGNLAGGVMMLVFKPFKVGDMIEAQGITGVVTEQGVFSTTVLTADNKTVFVPNGPLSTGVITNYTTHGNLRVDLTMAIFSRSGCRQSKNISYFSRVNPSKSLTCSGA
jgi:small conductance mechanosensitive channel